MRQVRDVSLSAINAGFITVLVGFTSSAAIVFQAAKGLGATPEQVASWMLTLGIGMAVTGIALSLRYRMPIATAWSTSGAAMLLSSASGTTMNEAIGAFMISGLLMTLAGFMGWFERLMDRIPMAIAAGMLAGILLQFGLDAFVAMESSLNLVFGMFLAYLITRRLLPRYAALAPLLTGLAIASAEGTIATDELTLALASPVFVAPAFSLEAFFGIALPLFAVTMASQNAPGLAVLKTAGYRPPVSSLVGWTGTTTTVLAPFGCFALNLATITAAICSGPEAHEDPRKRYVAGVSAGIFYLLTGIFGATVGALFAALPTALILAIAGLALISTFAGSLVTALERVSHRDAAVITFLVTASDLTLFGVGAAFWGMVAGGLTLLVLNARPQQCTLSATPRS